MIEIFASVLLWFLYSRNKTSSAQISKCEFLLLFVLLLSCWTLLAIQGFLLSINIKAIVQATKYIQTYFHQYIHKYLRLRIYVSFSSDLSWRHLADVLIANSNFVLLSMVMVALLSLMLLLFFCRWPGEWWTLLLRQCNVIKINYDKSLTVAMQMRKVYAPVIYSYTSTFVYAYIYAFMMWRNLSA